MFASEFINNNGKNSIKFACLLSLAMFLSRKSFELGKLFPNGNRTIGITM